MRSRLDSRQRARSRFCDTKNVACAPAASGRGAAVAAGLAALAARARELSAG